MRIGDWSKYIFRAIVASPLRSSLTALGIAIGIAAVSLLTAIGEGVRVYVIDNFSQFGTHIVAINPGKSMTSGMGGILNTIKPLSIEDSEAIRRLPHVKAVVPIVVGTARIEGGQRARNTDIYGVNHQAAFAWKFNVASGQFLPPDNPNAARPYAVLGYKVKNELFGQQNPMGEFIRVGDTRFRVVGVMESKGQFLGFDLDDVVYIPAARALQIFNRESLMEINVVYDPAIESTNMAKQIKSLLIDRHNTDDVTITTQDDMLKSLDDILSVLTFAITALGSISLFVGGVGVLTIMTLAVRERTEEIGLLRAIGTTAKQILLLFLGEAIVLATIGGLTGLLLMALLVVIILNVLPGLPLLANPYYLTAALLLATIIGLIAGILPARRAAHLNPIDALRNE